MSVLTLAASPQRCLTACSHIDYVLISRNRQFWRHMSRAWVSPDSFCLFHPAVVALWTLLVMPDAPTQTTVLMQSMAKPAPNHRKF